MKRNTFEKVTIINKVINRILGLRNFRDTDARCWTILNRCYKIFILITVMFLLKYTFKIIFELANVSNHIARAMYRITMILYVFIFFSMILCSWHYDKKLSRTRKSIAQMERKLMKLGVEVNHRNIFLWLGNCCVLSFVYMILYLYLYGLNYIRRGTLQISFIAEIFFNLLGNIGAIPLIDFMTYVLWLKNTFEQTNDFLKKLIAANCNIKIEQLKSEITGRSRIISAQKYFSNYFSKTRFRRNMVVPVNIAPNVNHPSEGAGNAFQEIRHIYLELCVIMKTVRQVFDTQLMFHIFNVLLSLIQILYSSYVQCSDFSKDLFVVLEGIAVYVLDGFYAYFKLILVSRICQKAIVEAKKMVRIIHVYSIYNSDPEIRNQIILFVLQISLSNVEKEESNICRMNDSFIRQTLFTISTYVIVLIQWYQSMIQDLSINPNSTLSNWNQFTEPTEAVDSHA